MSNFFSDIHVSVFPFLNSFFLCILSQSIPFFWWSSKCSSSNLLEVFYCVPPFVWCNYSFDKVNTEKPTLYTTAFFLAFWCTENCASWLSMSFLRCLNSELLRIMYIYIYMYLQITIENTWLSQSENDSQEDNQNFWQPFLEGSLDLLFLSHLSEFFFMPSHLSCKLIQSIVNHVFTWKQQWS